MGGRIPGVMPSARIWPTGSRSSTLSNRTRWVGSGRAAARWTGKTAPGSRPGPTLPWRSAKQSVGVKGHFSLGQTVGAILVFALKKGLVQGRANTRIAPTGRPERLQNCAFPPTGCLHRRGFDLAPGKSDGSVSGLQQRPEAHLGKVRRQSGAGPHRRAQPGPANSVARAHGPMGDGSLSGQP